MRKSSIHAKAALAGLLLLSGSVGVAAGDIVLAQETRTLSLQQGYSSGQIVKKGSYPANLIATARRSEDEIDECMNNPSNAHVPYIERLGACFCLATNNQTKGCQSAD